jgi:hypothetical protein
VKHTEHNTKPASTPKTGLFALLAALLCIAGSGAAAALPASASAYATAGGPPIYSSAPGLPDGRVYEQVSPADKNGNEAGAGAVEGPDTGENRYAFATPSGDSVLFEGTGAMGETADAYGEYFVATRTSGGWHTRSALPSAQESGAELGGTVGASLDGLDPSQDLSHVMFTSKRGIYSAPPNPKCGEVGEGQTYLAGSDPFVVATWLNRPEISDSIGACNGSGPVGGTPDFSTVYFTSVSTLLPEDSSRVEGGGFYEDAEGTLREVGVLPGGGLSQFGAAAATSPDRNEVSADGSRAFFVSPDPAAVGSCVTTEEGKGESAAQAAATCAPQLYVRENGNTTELVSQDTLLPDVGGLPAPAPADPEGSAASFAFASSDGSQAFFQSEDRLTSAAPEGPPGNTSLKTYDFDVGTGELTYLPGVVGQIVATDTDGSSLAFVRPEAGGAPAELDLWSAGPSGGSVTPITQLPGGGPEPVRMSSDGTVVVFSAGGLPGFNDPAGVHLVGDSYLPNLQIFRYDALANTLGCVSCAPAGVTPTGSAVISQPLTVEGDHDPGIVEARGISADGDRVFFDTPDPLVPQDTDTGSFAINDNGTTVSQDRDVYEWENGVVYLISSGKSTHNSYFLDNSENGDDVFFATTEGLAPGDTDGGYDVYDARVPQPGDNPPPAAVPCEGAVCQGPPNVPSPLTPPASVTFSGLGNPAPEVTPPPPPVKKTTTKTVKCKKNYVKKNDKCVRKAKPKKAKKSAHINRRASR